jgi:hypothetical protein
VTVAQLVQQLPVRTLQVPTQLAQRLPLDFADLQSVAVAPRCNIFTAERRPESHDREQRKTQIDALAGK